MSYSNHQPSESCMCGTYYLVTSEVHDYLTIYKIKSYLAAPMSNTISNFKMAKKTSILLEYPLHSVEWIESAKNSENGQTQKRRANHKVQPSPRTSASLNTLKVQPNFLLTYKDQSLIDFFDEAGNNMYRLDCEKVFESYQGLELVELQFVKLPKLVWSCRRQNLLPKQVQKEDSVQLNEILVIAGVCNYKGFERPFISRLNLSFSVNVRKKASLD